MKNIIPILLFTFIFGQIQGQDPTFCLDLEEVSNDGTTLVVTVGMMGSMPFDLGSSNLQFSFDQAKVMNPALETAILPSPNYQLTVSEPVAGEASLNIFFAFPQDFNFGTEMSDTEFTMLAQISFDIVVNAIDQSTFSWSYNGGTTQTVVYQDTPTNQIFATDDNPATCLITLPVDLLNFEVSLGSEMIADLDWDTRFEIFLSHFEIERSTNQTDWDYLGLVHSSNKSDRDIQHYGYKDNLSELFEKSGVVYYRLKLVDQNGQYFYSSIEKVFYRDSENAALNISVHPNPSNGIFTLFKNSNNNKLTDELIIYGNQGEKIFGGSVEFVNGSVTFSQKDVFYGLPAGVYNIIITDRSGNTDSTKLIIQK